MGKGVEMADMSCFLDGDRLEFPPHLRQNQRQTLKEATPEKEEIAQSINVSQRPARCESNGASYAGIPSRAFSFTSPIAHYTSRDPSLRTSLPPAVDSPSWSTGTRPPCPSPESCGDLPRVETAVM